MVCRLGFFSPSGGLGKETQCLPCVFLVCMEYLSRIMAYIGAQKEFKYHSRSKTLNPNHLFFADDLVLFYKGDSTSINMILRGHYLFPTPLVSVLIRISQKFTLVT